MSDSQTKGELKQRLLAARPQIAIEVTYACRKYNHGAPPEEVEELTEQIILLLLEDDYHRLKTYDDQKAQFSTWLRQVIRHEVSHCFQKLPATESLEVLSESQVSAAASQEEEVLAKEERVIVRSHATTDAPRPTHRILETQGRNGSANCGGDEDQAALCAAGMVEDWEEAQNDFRKKGGGKTYATLTSSEKYFQ